MSVEAVRRYKLVSLGAVDEAAALVSRVLPDLTGAECTEVVSVLASLAGATWQIANPGAALTELYTSDPALVRACIEVAPRLRRTGRDPAGRADPGPRPALTGRLELRRYAAGPGPTMRVSAPRSGGVPCSTD